MAVPGLRSWSGSLPRSSSVRSRSALGLLLWPERYRRCGRAGRVQPDARAFALAIGTSVLINMGKARYVW